jgi:hypothetical protein
MHGMGYAISASMEEAFCSAGKVQPFVVEMMLGNTDKSTARAEGVSADAKQEV